VTSDLSAGDLGYLSEARRIADVIDEHRLRAHRTASISEKVQLITAMVELRRTWSRRVEVLAEPLDHSPVDGREARVASPVAGVRSEVYPGRGAVKADARAATSLPTAVGSAAACAGSN
jgi:hypothetical protein